MKRLFDVQCTNLNCSEMEMPVEVWIHEGEFPECVCCNERTSLIIIKTPSVRLVGGHHAGFYNDGFINTGKSGAVRRSNPKTAKE